MAPQIGPVPPHPPGEGPPVWSSARQEVAIPSLPVDTLGRRIQVEWDPFAPVTPLGQLVFFCQFLAAGGLYGDWIAQCPLRYSSPNAPAVRDVLGTSVLAILSGACRYAHVTALRGDQVNPQGLGMTRVVSEDSLRRAFQGQDAAELANWQRASLLATCAPALEQPWIADLDVTIKPIYGRQEGAELGYNPHKPGRPSHAYHTVFVRTLRVALDVEVRSGKEHAAIHGLENLWRLWEQLTPARRPWLVCGDANYGNERMMSQCEARAQNYLFRQRNTPGVEKLIHLLERQGGWQKLAEGWEACEGELQLSGWTRKRRAMVLRRAVAGAVPEGAAPFVSGGMKVEEKRRFEIPFSSRWVFFGYSRSKLFFLLPVRLLPFCFLPLPSVIPHPPA